MKMTAGLFLFFSLVVSFVASGQIPQRINYQGRLVVNSNAVTGVTGIVFRLYGAASGGTAFYQETQRVAVADGLFAADIGASNAAPGALSGAFTNPAVWLELTVGPTVLSPRERLVSVGYAFVAGSVATGAITSASLANGTALGEISDNDGSGSGLDADMLDGLSSAAFSTAAHHHDAAYVNQAGDTMTGLLVLSNDVRLSSRTLWLRGAGDDNHGLAWFGSGRPFAGVALDGPALFGYEGGALGSMRGTTTNAALVWTDTGDVGIGTNLPSTKLDVRGGLRVNGGTIFSKMQGGEAVLGTSATSFGVYTTAFPVAFSAVPKVIATPKSDPAYNVNDTFSVTLRTVTTSNFVVNIQRVDSTGSFGQPIRLDWFAWE